MAGRVLGQLLDTLSDLGIAQSLPSPACQGLRSWRVRSSSQRDQKGRLRRARSWSGAPDGSPLLPQALAFVAFICLEVLSLSTSLLSSSSSLGAKSHPHQARSTWSSLQKLDLPLFTQRPSSSSYALCVAKTSFLQPLCQLEDFWRPEL